MYGYIYKTTNKINGKIYIGQKKSDKFLKQKYLGSGKRLQEAINKYGCEAFQVELLEEIETASLMDEREIYWIAYYKATNNEIGYNISEGGNVNRTMVGVNNPFYGKHHTQASKDKWKLSRKYKRGADNPRYGSHLSEEAKQKIGNKNRGRKKTPEEIAKHKATWHSHEHIVSDEVRQKISQAKTGKKTKARGCVYITNEITSTRVPKEDVPSYIDKGWRLGRKKFSAEACKNISKGHKGETTTLGKICITNDVKNKTINPAELDFYISQGWRRGRTLSNKLYNKE